MKNSKKKIDEGLSILKSLGLPKAQQNERSILCLLALIHLSPEKQWSDASAPLMGITPLMDFVSKHYKRKYAPNTRETFRRQTMHQFVQAGIALYNPDDPERPVNSPKAVYQIESNILLLLQGYNSKNWAQNLKTYLLTQETLAARYAGERLMSLIPITIAPGRKIKISPGLHSELIKQIIEEFAPRFAPGGKLIYVGDTGEKIGFFDKELFENLGVTVDVHGKMPDVVIYLPDKKWLLLIESVTSHGPVDPKRHAELTKLFEKCTAGLVYITAFPNRLIMNRFLGEIAWETEAWIAETPSHLIHFNGVRFLGPYVK